jgi:hypothetical protein
MFTKKKYAITLLEVLIGIILAGIILSFLFSLLRETLIKKQEIAQLKQIVLPREMMRLRINQIIGALSKNTPSIWTEYDSYPKLFFLYKNIDRDPNFCGTVCSMLYLNKNKQLCLSTFSEKNKERRNEVLLENIHNFTCTLFNPQKAIWQTEWLPEEKQPPDMIRLHLKIDQDTYDMVLFVTDPENPIPYSIKQ